METDEFAHGSEFVPSRLNGLNNESDHQKIITLEAAIRLYKRTCFQI
jgi:hypothetical protein